MKINQIWVVYAADSGWCGHLRYAVDKIVSGASCSACAITHNTLREKHQWQACRDAFPYPIQQRYRDQLSREQRAATNGQYPCVLGIGDNEVRLLLDSRELEQCHGSVTQFERTLRASLGLD